MGGWRIGWVLSDRLAVIAYTFIVRFLQLILRTSLRVGKYMRNSQSVTTACCHIRANMACILDRQRQVLFSQRRTDQTRSWTATVIYIHQLGIVNSLSRALKFNESCTDSSGHMMMKRFALSVKCLFPAVPAPRGFRLTFHPASYGVLSSNP
jgi:hypothetical protein